MAQIIDVPLGTTGDILVTESSGVITVAAKESFAAQGISANLSIDISAVALLSAWAASTSNSALKAILTEASVIAGALPK